MRACRGRAFSLLEMLLAAGLVLLLLTLLGQVLVPCLGILSRSSARSGLQQEARQALERLERDLRRSNSAHVSLGAGTLSVRRMADGFPVHWETEAVEYRYAAPTLTRGTAVLARNASVFAVTRDALGAYHLRLQLKEGDEVFDLSRTLYLRNH